LEICVSFFLRLVAIEAHIFHAQNNRDISAYIPLIIPPYGSMGILSLLCVIFMAAVWNRADHYILMLWFLSIYLLSFFHRLISAV